MDIVELSYAAINYFLFFFFNDTATTEIYTLSLHDALPILPSRQAEGWNEPTGNVMAEAMAHEVAVVGAATGVIPELIGDRSEERRVGKEGRSRWSPYH